jgi:hypothetical protein
VEKAIKEMEDTKAGDDDIPRDVLKLLGDGGLKQLTKDWPKDFIEVMKTALLKSQKATKCSDHYTVSLIAHAAKIVRILTRRLENKI